MKDADEKEGRWFSQQELHQIRNEVQAIRIGIDLFHREILAGETAASTREELLATVQRLSDALR